MDDRITIIHAPNGFGKTTLLRMLNGLFNGRISELEQVPFDFFDVDLEDGLSLSVRRPGNKKDKTELIVALLRDGKQIEETRLKPLDPREADFPLGAIDDIIPFLTRIGEANWRDTESGEELSFGDVMSRYEHMLPFRSSRQKTPQWLKKVTSQVKVRFVESQRLVRQSRTTKSRAYNATGVEPAVAFYSEQIAKEINRRLGEYAELSQSLDQTFPMRLVDHLSKEKRESLSAADLQDRLSKLDAKRRRLRDAGLLEKEDTSFNPPPALQELAQQVLPLYIADVEKKLGVFAAVVQKVELLKKVVSERFKYKTVTIDREKGITFEANGKPLSPTTLSSGEQHMLVLWSELIFMIDQNAMVLIDEPEISLHVAWQQDFLRELSLLTKLSNFDVLIATHSPQIINDRWDLTLELQGPPWPQ